MFSTLLSIKIPRKSSIFFYTKRKQNSFFQNSRKSPVNFDPRLKTNEEIFSQVGIIVRLTTSYSRIRTRSHLFQSSKSGKSGKRFCLSRIDAGRAYERSNERARYKRAADKGGHGSRLIWPSRRWTIVSELFY